MKQRMSKRLVQDRYLELRKSGLTKDQATFTIGQLILNFYGIAWTTLRESMSSDEMDKLTDAITERLKREMTLKEARALILKTKTKGGERR